MEPEFFLDTERLKAHAEELRQVKYIAQRLQQHLLLAEREADPSFAARFDSLVHAAEGLVRFFERLSEAMEDTSTEAELASLHVRRLIEDSRLDPDAIFTIDAAGI